MIIIHTTAPSSVGAIVGGLSLSALAWRGAVDVEVANTPHRLVALDASLVDPRLHPTRTRPRDLPAAVRIFVGRGAIEECGAVLATSPCAYGIAPAHEDRALCVAVYLQTYAADGVTLLAARHAAIITVVTASQSRRLALRWSDIGLLAGRDRDGVRPAEPYTIDLSTIDGETSWHWLRVLLRREPTAMDLHSVAVLQECERVAEVVRRTGGAVHHEATPVALMSSAALQRLAALSATSVLGRVPKIGEVITPAAWDVSAARRYLVRQMTKDPKETT